MAHQVRTPSLSPIVVLAGVLAGDFSGLLTHGSFLCNMGLMQALCQGLPSAGEERTVGTAGKGSQNQGTKARGNKTASRSVNVVGQAENSAHVEGGGSLSGPVVVAPAHLPLRSVLQWMECPPCHCVHLIPCTEKNEHRFLESLRRGEPHALKKLAEIKSFDRMLQSERHIVSQFWSSSLSCLFDHVCERVR